MKHTYTIPTQRQKYFDVEEYRKCGLQKEGGITIFNGGRNIGKTTGILIHDLKLCNDKEQLFYIRNTEKELKHYKATFNKDYGTQFIMTDTTIYRAVRKDWVEKKTGETKTTYVKGDVVGYCGALSGTDGWRSANFDNIKYIVADEYNQIGNSLNSQKFMTLWTSILRTKNNVYTSIIGNRDDVAADLLVELGVDILIPEDFKGDWVKPLFKETSSFYDKGFFIDIDDSRFDVDAVPTIWKELGRQMGSMGSYYDRGYKCYDNADCKKLDDEILDKITWKFSYSHNDISLIVGELNGVIVGHWNKDNKYEPKIKLASIPFCAKNKGYTPLDYNMDYPYYLMSNAMKKKQMLFTSILAKEELNDFLNELAYELSKKNGFEL